MRNLIITALQSRKCRLPLSNFVTLRSIRKLRMAVEIPRAAQANHSIPHTAPIQRLSFRSRSGDTAGLWPLTGLMLSFTDEAALKEITETVCFHHFCYSLAQFGVHCSKLFIEKDPCGACMWGGLSSPPLQFPPTVQ